MNKFTEIEIYYHGNACCFDKIKNSKRPTIIINTDMIVSLTQQETWGFCEGHEWYPFRKLHMLDGDVYYCVPESANRLERYLIGDVVSIPEESGECNRIRLALLRYDGNRRLAACELHISERTLYRKIKEYGLDQ